MFRFENESYLYWLLIVLAFTILYVVLQISDKKRLEKYCDKELLNKLSPERSGAMRHVKFAVLMLALACFIFAAANPQTAGQVEKTKRRGVDVMFCLDVSNSMLATDVQPSRLSACKMAMNQFINKLEGDRVGVVVFAGTAYTQLPITTDYAAAKMFIGQISPDLIPTQGTDLSAALETAAYALIPPKDDEHNELKKSDDPQVSSKVIVLVSDGEDHFPESAATAKELHELGIVIHTIGIGSTKGATIPVGNGVKRDANGNTVITRLNEQALKEVADAGGGTYVHAQNTNAGFETISSAIDKMEKSDIEDVNVSRYNSWYQYPLTVGIILLMIEGFLFATKPRWQKWLNRTRTKFRAASLLLCLIFCLTACGNKTRPSILNEANAEFHKGDSLMQRGILTGDSTLGDQYYQKALVAYDSAVINEDINRNAARFDQMDAHYRLRNYDTINYIIDTLLQTTPDKKLASQIYYNKGNTCLQKKEYQNAIEAYKDALRRNPSDFNAKYNLVYAQKMMDQHGAGGGGQGQGQGQNQNQQQNQQNGGGGGQDQQQQQNQQGQGNGQQEQQQKQQEQGNSGQNQQQQGSNGQSEEQRAAMLRQLDALQQNEKGTQQKVLIRGDKLNKEKNSKQKQEKDW